MREAVVHSCDVYFYQLGLRLGMDRLSDFMKRLALSDRTGIDIPQERRGLFPDPDWYDLHYGAGKWSKGLVLNLVIGQGETSLTPVKLVQLTSMIATNGTLWRPHILKSITRDGVELADVATADSMKTQVTLEPRDIAAVRDAMVAVVNETGGTGYGAKLDSVLVAGKTGTAQNPHGKDHALFICFAPAAKPEIAVAVLVENAGHGSVAAAPLAAKILRAYFWPQPDSLAAQPIASR